MSVCARVYELVCVSVRTRARPLVCARMVYVHLYPLAAFAEVLLVSTMGGGSLRGELLGGRRRGAERRARWELWMSEGLLVWGKPAGTGENVVSPHGSDVSWAPVMGHVRGQVDDCAPEFGGECGP